MRKKNQRARPNPFTPQRARRESQFFSDDDSDISEYSVRIRGRLLNKKGPPHQNQAPDGEKTKLRKKIDNKRKRSFLNFNDYPKRASTESRFGLVKCEVQNFCMGTNLTI